MSINRYPNVTFLTLTCITTVTLTIFSFNLNPAPIQDRLKTWTGKTKPDEVSKNIFQFVIWVPRTFFFKEVNVTLTWVHKSLKTSDVFMLFREGLMGNVVLFEMCFLIYWMFRTTFAAALKPKLKH